MNKKGFTLVEAIVVIVVLAFIGALLTPAIMKAIPNTYFNMFKKAYSTLTQISSELVNDPVMYPDGDLSATPCPDPSITCPCDPQDFIGCFIAKVNTVSGDEGNGQFTTDDGIFWTVENMWNVNNACNDYNNVARTRINASARNITVDLNGADNGPNECGQDIFQLSVCRNGKVFISERCGGVEDNETFNIATEYLNRLKKQVD